MTPDKFGSISKILRSAALGAALFVCAAPAFAQTVTVRTGDDGLVLEGQVVGYDGLHLRLLTEHGPLTLDFASVTCEGTACPDPSVDAPVLRFSGEARLGEVILPALTEGFARARGFSFEQLTMDAQTIAYVLRTAQDEPVLTLAYRATTTTDGFADLLADEADVVMATRTLTEDEVLLAGELGLGPLDDARHLRLLALDAVVPVASPSQTLRFLPLATLASAMRGGASSWADLGGEDIPLTVHMLDDHHGVSVWFQDAILGEDLRGDAVVHATREEMVEAMLVDRGALGILPMADVGNLHVMDLRDFCGITARRTAQSVRTEDYPLSYPMLLIETRRYMGPMAEAFLEWSRAPEAQAILRRAGVQTQAPAPISIGQQGHRLAAAISSAGADVSLADLQEMIGQLSGQARLSMTFRFDPTGQDLDLVSQIHARYLADILAEGAFEGQALTLVGFSDSAGGGSANRTVSRSRAEMVREHVIDALGGRLPTGVTLSIVGFGEALPIGCDDSDWGRRANRRVELWTAGLE